MADKKVELQYKNTYKGVWNSICESLILLLIGNYTLLLPI